MRRGDVLDLPTVVGVVAGGAGLVAALVFVRFCGEVAVPAKPPRPTVSQTPEQVNRALTESADVYEQGLARDALTAGVATPTIAEMGKALEFRESEQRFSLAPGEPTREVAGLRLSVIKHRPPRGEVLLALRIENPSSRPVVYLVDTEISTGSGHCVNRTTLEHDGQIVEPGATVLRSECAFMPGMELYVERVVSAEILPLQAFYLSLVPPKAMGADERASEGHRPSLPAGVTGCNVSMPQKVRNALEDGRIRWRDLADFFARHRCDDFRFPEGYRAFEGEGALALPVVQD